MSTVSLIPQLLITLSPDGELQVEQARHGVRHITTLPIGNAGPRLRQMLLAQKRQIEGQKPARRAAKQPDWTVIAKHPQVEIRQMLPGRGVAEGNCKSTVEDLGL